LLPVAGLLCVSSLCSRATGVRIVCADNTWGRTYLDVWRAEAAKHGVKVVDENCISDYTTDMRSEVLRAKSQRPDGVIIAFGIDRALRRMKEVRFSPKVLTTSDLDEAINSRGFPASEAEGVYFADWLATDDFQRRFRERFHSQPIMAPQNSFEAIITIAEAMRRSKGDLQSSIQELNYSGATGPIDYRGSRAGNRGSATLLKVSGGRIQSCLGRTLVKEPFFTVRSSTFNLNSRSGLTPYSPATPLNFLRLAMKFRNPSPEQFPALAARPII